MATRWAICGAGKIAKDFCTVINTLPRSEHQIVAVATAKDEERAAKFAESLSIPKSFGTYEELAALSNIDVVYVSCIQPFHVETCLLFIQSGMNVLCEKTMAMSLAGCRQIIAAAKAKQVFLLEGYWTRFFPVYRHLLAEIRAGELGEVKHVDASFCAKNITEERLKRWRIGGGGLMDIGCYTLLLAGFFFKGRPSITVQGTLNKEGMDIGAQMLLKFDCGGTATAHYSCETVAGSSSLLVRGTCGNAMVKDNCWCPNTLYINGEKKDFPLPDIKADFNYPNSEGFQYEIECVRKCLQQGLNECPDFDLEQSERQAWMLQQVHDQLGISYNCP